jgi:hydroxymethylbilane synthase
MIVKIGTRGSKLAMTQSTWVKKQIEAKHEDVRVELVRIKTRGDKILDSPLSLIGGKGLFVKEIEEALVRGDVDLAVHSMKDVPSEIPEGLELGVFPEREDPRDAFISFQYKGIDDLPEGSRVGTSSLRRGAQLLHRHPDLELVPVRGNVDTRLRKLESGEFDSLVLASAGLRRLGLEKRISQILPTHEMLPAVAQGALGLEMRRDNGDLFKVLSFLNHGPTEVTIRAERAFLKELEGGCQVPIAGHASVEGKDLVLSGMVAEPDGTRLIRDDISGDRDRPEELGTELAGRLLQQGADRILARVYGNASPSGKGT